MPSSISSSKASLAGVGRIVLAAVAIFVAYDVLVAVLHPPVTPSSDTGIRNRVVAERYFDDSAVPAAVIVGSSLAFRLSPDFLEADSLGPEVYDLALAGGSAASGLDIVLRKRELPRIVLVEANILYRAADPALLRAMTAEPRLTLRRYFPALRLEYRPVDLAVTMTWTWLRRRVIGAASAAAEPDIPDFDARLAATLAQNDTMTDALRQEIESGLQAAGKLVDELRAHGVRVVLMSLPVHPSIASSAVEQYTRMQVSTRFPRTSYEWLDISDAASYRTDDGMHLTRPSGRRLAAKLRGFVSLPAPAVERKR